MVSPSQTESPFNAAVYHVFRMCLADCQRAGSKKMQSIFNRSAEALSSTWNSTKEGAGSLARAVPQYIPSPVKNCFARRYGPAHPSSLEEEPEEPHLHQTEPGPAAPTPTAAAPAPAAPSVDQPARDSTFLSAQAWIQQLLLGALKGTATTGFGEVTGVFLSYTETFLLNNLDKLIQDWEKAPATQGLVENLRPYRGRFVEAFAKQDLLTVFALLKEIGEHFPLSINGFMAPPSAEEQDRGEGVFTRAQNMAFRMDAESTNLKVNSNTKWTNDAIRIQADTLVKRFSTQTALILIFDTLLQTPLSKAEQLALIQVDPEILLERIHEIIKEKKLSGWRETLGLWMAGSCLKFIHFCIDSSTKQVLKQIMKASELIDSDPKALFKDISAYCATLTACLKTAGNDPFPDADVDVLTGQNLERVQQKRKGYSSSKLYAIAADEFLRMFSPKVNWYSGIDKWVKERDFTKSFIGRLLKPIENFVKSALSTVLYLLVFIPEWVLNSSLSLTLRIFARWFGVFEEFVTSCTDAEGPKNHIAIRYALTTFFHTELQKLLIQVGKPGSPGGPVSVDDATLESAKTVLRNFFDALKYSKCKTLNDLQEQLKSTSPVSKLKDQISAGLFEASLEDLAIITVIGFHRFNKPQQKKQILYEFLQTLNNALVDEQEVSSEELVSKEMMVEKLLSDVIYRAIRLPIERKLDVSGQLQKGNYERVLKKLQGTTRSFFTKIQTVLTRAEQSVQAHGWFNFAEADFLDETKRFIVHLTKEIMEIAPVGSGCTAATKLHIISAYFEPVMERLDQLEAQILRLKTFSQSLKRTESEQKVHFIALLSGISTSFREDEVSSSYLHLVKITSECLTEGNLLERPLQGLSRELEDYALLIQIKERLGKLYSDIQVNDLQYDSIQKEVAALLQEANKLQGFHPMRPKESWVASLEPLQEMESLKSLGVVQLRQHLLNTSQFLRLTMVGKEGVSSCRERIITYATELCNELKTPNAPPLMSQEKAKTILEQNIAELRGTYTDLNTTVQGFQAMPHKNISISAGSGAIIDIIQILTAWGITQPVQETIRFLKLPYNMRHGFFNLIARRIAGDNLPAKPKKVLAAV